MTKHLLVLLVCLLAIACTSSNQADETTNLKLWYDKPAQYWEEALPIGNGRLGGMVYGGVRNEQIQLNEETIWAGEPGNNIPEGFAERLGKTRKLIFDGKFKEAEALMMEAVPRPKPDTMDLNYGMPYQTLGDLHLNFDIQGEVSDYYRDLNIANAVSSLNFVADGVQYKREYLASAVDGVIAIRLTASKKGKISFSLHIDSPHTSTNSSAENNRLCFSGYGESEDNKEGKIHFDTEIAPKCDGGKLEITDNAIRVEQANAVTILISAATNYENYNDISGDAKAKALNYLASAETKDFAAIKEAHIADYKQYFDRVHIDLGETPAMTFPTNERVANFKTANDPQLVSLYFQYGRYLLISSSRPGTQPANLQGIWNNMNNPPWDSKYTVNINTEMNYWPAEVTNLSEMHQPLFSMLKDLSETGKETAQQMYGVEGWAMHHNTDLWRITGIVDGAFYGMWPMGGAWLTQHIWQHYLFTGDKQFLEEVYPIMKGITTFYAQVLQKDPNTGYLLMVPSMSPENRHPGGTAITAGTTMDNQLVFDVFSNYIQMAEILGVDESFAQEVKAHRAQLPPMKIGKINQLQEWQEDWDRANDKHRHISHLYGLHPSNQISPFEHPELFQAAKNTLEYRGDESTGWSMGWKVNFWARLLDGNRAYKLIADQLSLSPVDPNEKPKAGTYPNLFDAHPPFQIDGNFGCTAGIAEMLMQSHDGAIFLLPALPDNWKNGSIAGICARGGFELAIDWKNGALAHVEVLSKLGGTCRIRTRVPISGAGIKAVTEDTPNENPFYARPEIKDPEVSEQATLAQFNLLQTYLYDVETEAGASYQFVVEQ